jgi:hypothetical protein
MLPRLSFLALVLFASALACAQNAKCPPPPSLMKMDKGEYSNQPGVIFNLESFAATLQPRGKRAPNCYVKTAVIDHGTVFVSSDSLTHLFGQKLTESNNQLKDVQIEMKDNEVHLTGKMKKLIWIPFSAAGPLTTDGTNLRIETKSIKAMGVPVKGLMDALGKHLQTLTGSESPKGVIAQGDTLIFQPYEIAHVRGHITSVGLSSQGMTVHFGGTVAKK